MRFLDMIKKIPTKRIRNPEKTRAKLLDATIDLISEKGPHSLSVIEAARVAKVSRGIAYHHFKDRNHLLREAMNVVAHRLEGRAKRRKGASLHDRVLYSTLFVFENPDICRLMITEAIAGKNLDRQHPMVKFDIKLLQDLISSGQGRTDLDPEIVAYISIGTIGAVLMLREQYKGEDMDALAERFTNEWISILTNGIFARGVNAQSLKYSTAPPPPARSKTTRRR